MGMPAWMRAGGGGPDLQKAGSAMKFFADNSDYYHALKRIASYDSVDRLRRTAEKTYGLSYEEAIEMAYENIINEAKTVVRGKRPPKKGLAAK